MGSNARFLRDFYKPARIRKRSSIRQYIHAGWIITGWKDNRELCEKCSEISRCLEAGIDPPRPYFKAAP
jgi:hypothetical protein